MEVLTQSANCSPGERCAETVNVCLRAQMQPRISDCRRAGNRFFLLNANCQMRKTFSSARFYLGPQSLRWPGPWQMNVSGCASASLVPNSEVLGVHLIFPRDPYRDESKRNLPHSGQSLWCLGSLVTSGNEPHRSAGCTFWRHFISDSFVFFPFHDCVLNN